MELEVDEPLDGFALEGVIGPAFESTPDESNAAALAVTFAYTGRRGGVGNEAKAAHSFTGPNPISMDPEHLDTVRSEEYVVSAKTDGTRYQIVTVKGRVMLVDRTMRSVTTTYSHVPEMFYAEEGTVLDAEFVFVGARSILYVFDVVMVGGLRSVSSLSYKERMDLMKEFGTLEVGFGSMLIEILPKPIFDKRHAHQLMTDPSSLGILGNTDGIVFTPVNVPIQLNTHWSMFKVKLHHTLDFRLVLIPHKFGTQDSRPPESVIPPSIAEKMRNQILKNAIKQTSAPASAAPPAPKGLLAMVGRTGARAAAAGPAAETTAASRTSAATSASTSAATSASTSASTSVSTSAATSASTSAAASARMQWIPRLEYSSRASSTSMPDATTHGIEYGGYTIVLRITDDPMFNALLDKIEAAYRKIDGQVVSLSVIVECNIQISAESLGSSPRVVLPVKIERTRPDKHEPNSYLTITRTLTSILQGVTTRHLLTLARDE